jgi:hypothetical protein
LPKKEEKSIFSNKGNSSFNSDTLSKLLDAYQHDIFARVEPSFLNSRQACLDAHDFSKILAGSPLVAPRLLKRETE